MTEHPVFPNLPIKSGANPPRPARVCIATYEILGPSQSGGIGTAYYSLATALAAAKHQVTILYLWASRSDKNAMQTWQKHFRNLGISFVPLPASRRAVDVPDCMLTARDAYQWLRARQFDVVHFPELHGHGYYCVLAKHQGLDFAHTTICIGTHSPITWLREQNREAPYSPDELEMDYMERQCVALADVVVSPSQYMLKWMQSRGWVLPPARYVQPNIVVVEGGERNIKCDGAMPPASEFVFFGRLEARKGLGLFCDALDRLNALKLPGLSIAFLGRNGRIAGIDAVTYIRARAKAWSFPSRIITNYGREAALRFLGYSGRVAIIPSVEDNLPSTVSECLAGGIPFLAGRGGGIPELIAPSDLERLTFPADDAVLASRLALATREGLAAARPAFDAAENKSQWINWHSALVANSENDRPLFCSTSEPLVTICLNYRGDAELLAQSLFSVRHQTYPSLEVILLDSTESEIGLSSPDLTRDFGSTGWRIIRHGKDDCGATTCPALEARGQYVLFMKASDYLTTDAIATFVNVARDTNADILTSCLALFAGSQPPTEASCLGYYPFLGGAILPGVFRNRFGLRVIFIKRDVLLRIGAPSHAALPECADWEFLARSALMQDRLEVIPAALAWYRIADGAGPQVAMDYPDQVRAVAPYAQAMPSPLHDLPRAALAVALQYQRLAQRFSDSPAGALLRACSRNDSHNGTATAFDDIALIMGLNQLPRRTHKRLRSMLEGWLEYSSARSQLPAPGLRRILHVARHLARGHYHRYSHGFGSALRDLRWRSRGEGETE